MFIDTEGTFDNTSNESICQAAEEPGEKPSMSRGHAL